MLTLTVSLYAEPQEDGSVRLSALAEGLEGEPSYTWERRDLLTDGEWQAIDCAEAALTVTDLLTEEGDLAAAYRCTVAVGERCATSEEVSAQTLTVAPLMAMALTASPTSGTCGPNLTWRFDSSSGTLTISGTGKMYDYSIGGQPWSTWKYHYETPTPITSAVVEEGVTEIGKGAFQGHDSLRTVKLPSTLTKLSDNAFDECGSLQSIVIPDQVESIGVMCFQMCYELKSVRMPADLKTMGSDCFYGCGELQSIVVPNQVKIIPEAAFEYCSALKSVTLPASLTTIEANAFGFCGRLTGITFPAGLRTIGNYAFVGCNISPIIIPDQVTSIGKGAFSSQSVYNSTACIKLPASVTYIGDNAIDDTMYFICEKGTYAEKYGKKHEI